MTINIYWDGDLGPQNPHYALLSSNDKRFLRPDDLLGDMSVPTMMLMTGIGFITEDTIPHLIERIDFANGKPIKDRVEDRSQKMGYATLADHFRVFIGVTSNIRTETTHEFVKRCSQALPSLDRRTIDKMITRRNKMKKGKPSEPEGSQRRRHHRGSQGRQGRRV